MIEINKKKKKEIIDKILSDIKLEDVGKKHKKDPSFCNEPNEVYYPSINLTAEQVPELKKYKVNEKVIMILEGEIKGHNIDEYKDKKHESFNVSMKKIGIKPKKED